jgi:ABC-type uncharacterized transport system YnjBCD ATPase subunit
VFERLRSQGVPAVLVTHDAHDVPALARVIRLEEPTDSTEDSS